MRVRGTTLHVVCHGPEDAPALLYVHGGPGQGSYDFLSAQCELLSRGVRLVAVDQRGALRSAPLPSGATLTIDSLIADFEAIRQALNLENWTVLGHSFGGRIALRYALDYPGTVVGAAFENPDWDGGLSTRAHLSAALPLLDELGQHRAGAQVRRLLADPPQPGPQTWRTRRRLLAALRERRLELYVHDPDVRRRLLATGFPSEALPADQRERGAQHAVALTAEPDSHQPLLHRLPELRRPALLLYGAHDPLAAPEVLAAFARTPNARLQRFDQAGHFVHLEQPEPYAAVVRDFVRSG